MLSGAILRNTQCGVIASLPMNDHLNLVQIVVHADDDLLDNGSHNALANLVAGCRIAPSQWQISAQSKQRFSLLRGQ